jgi:hypothetical protein
MEFHFSFHVKTSKDDLLLALLQQCTGIFATHRAKHTDDILDNILTDKEAAPDYLSIGRNNVEWFTVEHNSFKKLHDWGATLSEALNTLFLQTTYCSVDGYAYLLAYEKGRMIREIEADNKIEIPLVNQGTPFDFEQEELRLFDQDSLMDYCTYLGIDTINERRGTHCTVLKHTDTRSCGVVFNMQRELAKAMQLLEKRTRLTNLK